MSFFTESCVGIHLALFHTIGVLQEQGGSGILSGAGLEPMRAVFDSLEMTGTGGDGAIGYRVHFIEDRG